jgi:MoaA/NifB/PqqE/SkfB family radical SAM enzyme
MSISFDHYPVKVLHLEPTTLCNAACPLCPRENPSRFNKEHDIHHLTVDQIKELFSPEFIKNLDKMFMCGNYGDPAAGVHTLDIYRYFRKINPDITLGMNTNGSLRNRAWWTELAGILSNPLDFVIFSIDGLEDTNHLYRVNTQWEKIIKNTTAFIQAGGNAQWDMLIYDYNSHQVDDAQSVARQMGFSWFRAKVSNRKNTIAWLQPPAGWVPPLLNTGPIMCHAEKEQSLYVSAAGIVHPCCFLGHKNDGATVDQYQEIKQHWNTLDCHPKCKLVCSTDGNSTHFSKQWRLEVDFKC